MRYYGLNEDDVNKFRSRDVMKNLFESLNENENFISYKIAEGLGEFENKKTVNTLIDALEDDDESVREMVINTLGRIGDRNSVTSLISHIENNDELKELVILALGEIGGRKSLEFIKLALNEDNLEIKLKAIEALGKISHPESIEELIYALMDDNLEVKLYSLASLGEIGDSKAIKPLRRFLNNRKWIVRKYALNALGKIAECPLEIFIKALNDKDYRVREKAVEIIGIRGDEKSIDSLKPMLNDSNDDVKQRVREILKKHQKLEFEIEQKEKTGRSDNLSKFIQKIGKDKVVEILSEYFEMEDMITREETDYPVEISHKIPGEKKEEISEEISGKTTAEDVDPILSDLCNQISDKIPKEKEMSEEISGKTQAEVDLEPILNDLCYGKYSVWWGAKEDLKELGPAAVEPLINLLEDENQTVRGRVVLALSEIGDERAITPLIKHLEVESTPNRKKIALSLYKFGKKAIKPLTEALKHQDFEIRESAAEALGEIGDKAALDSLEKALNDENVYVRNRVKTAIRRINTLN